MYCIYCGKELRDGAKFCTECGKPVKTAAKSAVQKVETVKAAAGNVKKILAALKDSDIVAPASTGEVRCKMDAAQNAFVKMLKKGLLCAVFLFTLLATISAQDQVIRKTTAAQQNDDSLEQHDWEMKKPFSGSFNEEIGFGSSSMRARATGGMLSGTPYQSYTKAANKKITIWYAATIKAGETIHLDLDVLGSIDKAAAMNKSYISLNSTSLYSKKQYIRWTDETSGTTKPKSQTCDYTVVPEDSEVLIIMSYTSSSNFDYTIRIDYKVDGAVTASDRNVTVDSNAENETGEKGWVVPAVVIGGLAVGLLALRGRKNKKKDNKEDNKENNKEKEDDEEGACYEMRISKDFGDTLTPGQEKAGVYARIVRITADGKESTDETLTSAISITGDNYLKVSGQGRSKEYMAAWVEAPEKEVVPDEAVVCFRLAGGGASFTNRMHFKIARSGIIFFQENITLPACSDEEWRLPFYVQGASADAVVEICGSCQDGYDVKVEPGDKEGFYYAVIKEKSKDKKEPGTWEEYFLGVRVKSGSSEFSDSISLYRFHMGLRFSPHDTLPCYLETDAAGRTEVAKTIAQLVYFDWDPEMNDIVTVFPVPKEFKITAAGETEQGYLEKLGITCEATSVTTDNGRQLQIYPVKGLLDAPTRFKATISLTADCGEGRTETVSKEVMVISQPVRQNVSAATLEEDRRISEGLMNIQKSIWDHGEYSRLFPLYKLIDVMLNGYDGAYGYDRNQVETVKDVYRRFLNGDLVGANATARRVTLADEMALFVDSFLQTGEEVENSMGFFTRMAVGVATLGMSDAVFTGLKVARDMKATAEKGGETWDVFVAGVKVVAMDYAMEQVMNYGLGKLNSAAKKYAPKQYEAVAKSAGEAKQKASDYFSGITGKKTGKVLEKSKGVKTKASEQADEAVEAFKKNPKMSELDESLDQVYKNGKAHGKAKVDDLRAAQWLAENNPTPENINLYKKKVLEVQRDKFAMQQLNNLPDGNATRARFNKELDNVYKDVDEEVRDILKKKGYDMDDKPFAATSSNKADLEAGNKVTYDRDVTYKTKDGVDVPQDVAQEAYEKAFYKRTTGIDAPNGTAAGEWAQMHDQTIVQNGSPVSYGDDLNPVIKDWDVKLSNAERTGNVMTYKSTEWFRQTEQMIRKANTLSDRGLRLDMLEQALSKRQEATRQMVKQFKYVHARDVAAQVEGAASRISDKMRFGMEISSRLFSSGEDALTLTQVESILAQNDLTLELLSLQLGETLKKIG
jgi:hypothetical protein